MADDYHNEVVEPGDRVSKLAAQINRESFENNPGVLVMPHTPGNFRGPVGWVYADEITELMLGKNGRQIFNEVENDGAGGKPQFFTLVGLPEVFAHLSNEILAMTVDDFARSGRLGMIIVNQADLKGVSEKNYPLIESVLIGFGKNLKRLGLVSITGETAIMKYQVTAFCDTNDKSQLIMSWNAACIGICHRDRLINNKKIKPKMTVVGLADPGYRCNGGTKLTNITLHKWGPNINEIRQNEKAMEFVRLCCTPSVIYAPLINQLLGWNIDGSLSPEIVKIAGCAHITGGGWEKVREVLPTGIGMELDNMVQPGEVLLRAQALAWHTPQHLTEKQMHTTFNGGTGMVLILENENDVPTVVAHAARLGITAQPIGYTNDEGGVIRIMSRFAEGGEVII